MVYMSDLEGLIERMDVANQRNQHETRENLDKMFTYIARLEVAVGKLTVQLEEESRWRAETKVEIKTLRDRVRHIEMFFAPVVLLLGTGIAVIAKKLGL